MANVCLPLEIWHKIFALVFDPHQELFITSWNKKHQVPRVKSSQLGRFQADLHVLQLLGREDILFPGSASAFWKWLVPLASWRVELSFDKRGKLYDMTRATQQTKRLETHFGSSIKHIVVVIEGTHWGSSYDESYDEYCYHTYPPLLGPSIVLLESALKHFWDVHTFDVVVEMHPGEAGAWRNDGTAVWHLWTRIWVTDGGLDIHEEDMSMQEIRDALSKKGCTFTVAVRGALPAEPTYRDFCTNKSKWNTSDTDITTLFCDVEECKRDAYHRLHFDCAERRWSQNWNDYCKDAE